MNDMRAPGLQAWPTQRDALDHARACGVPCDVLLNVVHEDGDEQWLAARGEVMCDQTPAVVKLRASIPGIQQEWLEMEDALAARIALHQANFLACVNHELRTPLNGILGLAQLLRADTTLTPPQRNWMEHIEQASLDLLRLIERLLATADAQTEAQNAEPKAIDLGHIARDCLSSVNAHAARQHIELIDLIPPERVMPCLAHVRHLALVIDHILDNAIRYNHANGRVIVSISDGGSHWMLDVADSGSGMTEAQIARLFVPFERMGVHGDSRQGLGLGLVQSRELVKAMGGTLEVCSDSGKGTSVSLRLVKAA